LFQNELKPKVIDMSQCKSSWPSGGERFQRKIDKR
jgi:hypothetical protein